MKTYAKFGALVTVILGVITWLFVSGTSQSKSYYKTISELAQMGDKAHVQKLRVDGYVEPGSIVRNGAEVSFTLHQDPSKRTDDAARLKVVYAGIDPLPDTFKDDAQTIADGKLGADGVFHANRIQAKCASKYEAKPQLKKEPSQASI